MSAIIIRPAPNEVPVYSRDAADHMPFATRLRVAEEINRAWREFTEDMHDGPLTGNDVAEKFWKFVTGT